MLVAVIFPPALMLIVLDWLCQLPPWFLRSTVVAPRVPLTFQVEFA